MADTVLLFFAGALAVVVLSKIAGKIRPGTGSAGAAKRLLLLVLASLVIGSPLGWVAWAPLAQPYLFDFWPFIYWIILGRAIAVLIGCLAGFVLVAALGAINYWGPGADLKSIVILAAGPLLTILALYLLAVPGARQSLGLTGIKAGEFEITLAAPTATSNSPVPVNSFSPIPVPGGGALDDYSGWFNNMWPMLVASGSPPKEFTKRGYFEREIAYLKYIAKINWDRSDPEPQKRIDQATEAFKKQKRFIQSLRPIIGCVGFYHTYLSDVGAVRSIVAPFIEAMVALEQRREEPSLKGEAAKTDFDINQKTLQVRANQIVIQVREALRLFPTIPNNAQFDATKLKPNYGDCAPVCWRFDMPAPPGPADDDLEPPYLAMAIANVYGALGEKRAGLDVLNKWLRYYKSYRADHPDAPIWFMIGPSLNTGSFKRLTSRFPQAVRSCFI